MIRLTFNRSDIRVQAAFKARGPKIVEALRLAMEESMTALLARVQAKLSGEVLQSRKGGAGLLGSARKEPVRIGGGRIIGSVTAGGKSAPYGIVHEKGGTRTYEILPGILTGKSNKRALAFFPQGSPGAGALRLQGRRLMFKAGPRRGSLKPGKGQEFSSLGGIVVMKVIHPPLPARPFMRTALDELRGQIIANLRRAAADAISK